MKPKDDLFLLIKSLSKTEKGYFSKFAQMHGGTTEGNYLKLYNLIEAMDSYDEAALKQSIAGTSLAKHLSVSKNYLFKFILRALSSFHRDNIPELQIYHLLAEERVLRARRINVSSESQVKKAAEIARQLDETQFLPLTSRIVYDQNIRTCFEDNSDEEYAAWKNDFLQTGEHQLQEMQFSILHMDVLRVRGNFAQYEQTLKEAVAHPLMLANDPVHLSVKTRIVYWVLWTRYHRLRNDTAQYIYTNQSLYDMLQQQSEEYREKNAHLIINTLAILGAAWLQEENREEVERVLEQLAQLDVSNHVGLHRLQRRCLLEIKLSYLKLFGAPGDMVAFEAAHSQEMEAIYANEIPLNQGAIRFMLGVALMLDHATDKALDYFNWLLNDKTYATYGYYPFCWYWTILAHHELGNKTLMPSLISSATNACKSRFTTRPLEKELLKTLKDLAKAKTESEEPPIFVTLHHLLQQAIATANPVDKRGYEELVQWLGGKLTTC